MEDFELQMLDTEQFSAGEEEEILNNTIEDQKISKHRVQFSDEISYSEPFDSNSYDIDTMPEKFDKYCQTRK